MGFKYWKKQRFLHDKTTNDIEIELDEDDTHDIEVEELTLMHILNRSSFFNSATRQAGDDEKMRLTCFAE